MFTGGSDRPTKGGHDEAYRVEEQQYDKNDEISSTISSTMLTRAQQRRFGPVTLTVSLEDR